MEEIAAVYARSLFEAALEQDKLDVVREQLGEFADALDADRELQVFFFSPYFSTQEKKDGLHRAVDGAEPIFLNFLELLLENHRMPAIFRIRREYDAAVGEPQPAPARAGHLRGRARRGDRAAGSATGSPSRPAARSSSPRPSSPTSSAASSSASATRCSTPPSATASTHSASRSSGPSRRDLPRSNRKPPCRSSLTRSRPSSRAASRASTRARRTSPRSARSCRWPTASRASTASRTACRSRCSSCRTTSPGLALNLESDNVGAVLFGPWGQVKEGDTVKRTSRLLEIPVGDALLGRIIDPLGRPLDGKGDINLEETRPGRVQGPGRRPAPAGEGAAADRHQGDRRDDPDRPRPARADHRRPPDRQDGDRDRHDHQQQGLRRRLDLRRDRAAHGHRGRRRADARGGRRDGQHDHRRRGRRRGRPDQVPRPVRGRGDRRVLPLQGRARADDLRRPDQARLRLPPDVAAAAPPAGSRGLPGRRLLPAQPPARARLQAVGRARRRLADVAADHRDAGRRRVGLHPDERDLDHRRADLPRAEAVLLGRAPGDQRRHLGVARRRQRADRADEEGRRAA